MSNKKLNEMCKYFHATDLYICPKCRCELRNYMQELQAKCAAVPIEIKQKYLDILKDGKTIGEAISGADPESKYPTEVWHQIVANQIEVTKQHIFNYTAK